MALIGNYSLINRTPVRQFNTGVSSGYGDCFNPPSAVKNRFFGGYAKQSATPNGYLAPGAWVLPLVAGGMSSYSQNPLAISVATSELLIGKGMTASSAMTIAVLSAILDKVIEMIASGTLSISSAAALSAAIDAAASGSMSISVSSAILGGIVPMTVSGSLTISTDVDMTALAAMTAEAGGPTALSPEGLAAAVLNALLADFNDAGTVGEALNNVGASGNPWASALASNTTDGTFGAFIQALLKKNDFIGLK